MNADWPTLLAQSGITVNTGWREFTIQHGQPIDDGEKRRTLISMRSAFGNLKGVYVYLNQSSQVLYVGMGNLAERTRFHYYESMGQAAGRGSERHIRFFTQHPGLIRVYWISVSDVPTRRGLKRELTGRLQPLYEVQKHSGLLG